MIENSQNPDQYLDHQKWQVRNLAVKELGKRPSSESKNKLCGIIQDTTPSSWWLQIMGEPLKQVGFIRRNAWAALANQDIDASELARLAKIGRQDSYYEVRAQMYKTIKALLEKGRLRLIRPLIAIIIEGLHHEKNFEVKIACIELISFVYDRTQVLQIAPMIVRHKQWQVREAFLGVLCKMFKEEKLFKEDIEGVLESFNMGSEYFRPTFILKETRAQLDELLAS